MVIKEKHRGLNVTACILKVDNMKLKTLILLVFLPVTFFAQNSVKQAYFEFDRFEYARCIELFENAQQAAKLDSKDFFLLSYSYYMTGDYTKCLTVLDELIKRGDNESFHFRMKGDAFKELKQYDQAIAEYTKFGDAELMELVDFDIASCNYLKSVEETSNAVQTQFEFNTRKADALYYEEQFGWVRFHELGVDSLKSALSLKPADDAELMLMRPYVNFNKEWTQVSFPETLIEAAITSFSKDPFSNQVIFTVTELLSKQDMKHFPHLYVGDYDKDLNAVSNVHLFQFSELNDSTSTAFGVFEPTTGNLIYSQLKSGLNSNSDFFYTKKNDGTWATPNLLSSVNTPGDEMYVHFTKNEIFFSSAGRYGYGNLDCYHALFDPETMIAAETKHFPKIINSENDDFWYFNNYDTIIITSNRIGANAEDDVWQIIDQDKVNQRLRDQAYQDSLARARALQAILAWQPPYVYFVFTKDVPNSDYSFMDELSKVMSENPSISVLVEGNTDIRGESDDNVWLSQKRADFVLNELVKRGIPKERIKAIGKGEALSKTNSTEKSSEEIHQQNRVSIIKLVTSL